MTDDLRLWDLPPHPRARRRDPQTSLDAARSVTAGRVETLILDVHRACRDGLTDDELVASLPGLYGPTVRSARSRLSRRGSLVDSGVRRLSGRGRAQIVWRVG